MWDTAVHYHLVHSLALLLCGSLTSAANTRALRIAGCCFGLGILLFSGSLYGLSLGGPRLLGPVTPLGGLLLITGWLALAVGAVRRPEHEPPRGS